MTSQSSSGTIESAEWWRAVQAEFPTGVVLVSGRTGDGDVVAMVAGSFVAISQDPPLVGFFGDDASSTFQSIAGSDRFAVSVFGATHDGIMRSFIRKDPDRHSQPGIIETDDGLIRLENAVAWFEARTDSVQRFGDHRLVVGEVTGFGVSSDDAGGPMIYRRGGFGTFAVPADAVDARIFGERLGAAQAAAEVLATVAQHLERDIAITSVIGESVVILGMVPAARDVTGGPLQAVGVSFPFAAPVEPLFAAWAPDNVRSFWIERARHLVGFSDRRRVEAQLAGIRERGFSVSVDQDLMARFFALVTDPTVERDSYARAWSDFAARTIESATADLPLADIAAIQVPVFDAQGDVALVLTVSDVGPFEDRAQLEDLAARLTLAAEVAATAIRRTPRGRS